MIVNYLELSEERMLQERWSVVKERMIKSFKEFLAPFQISFMLDEKEITISTKSSDDIKRGRYVLMEAIQAGYMGFTDDDIERYIVDNVGYVDGYIELAPNNVNEFIEELMNVAYNDMIDDYMNYDNISLNGEYDWIAKELNGKMYKQ